MVWLRFATVKLWLTFGAAAKRVAHLLCLDSARPAATIVTVLPLSVHTAVVASRK